MVIWISWLGPKPKAPESCRFIMISTHHDHVEIIYFETLKGEQWYWEPPSWACCLRLSPLLPVSLYWALPVFVCPEKKMSCGGVQLWRIATFSTVPKLGISLCILAVQPSPYPSGELERWKIGLVSAATLILECNKSNATTEFIFELLCRLILGKHYFCLL